MGEAFAIWPQSQPETDDKDYLIFCLESGQQVMIGQHSNSNLLFIVYQNDRHKITKIECTCTIM